MLWAVGAAGEQAAERRDERRGRRGEFRRQVEEQKHEAADEVERLRCELGGAQPCGVEDGDLRMCVCTCACAMWYVGASWEERSLAA